MNAVSIVTIKNKISLFKGEEKAERIELIELEENGFPLVSQKDLYQIGDKAIYIQPDYNLSDISLFESFLRPGGDVSKSMLGRVEGVPLRIRAKKFNFHKGDGQAVYSNGILLPVSEVEKYCKDNDKEWKSSVHWIDNTLQDVLGITKWEEPEQTDKFGIKTGASVRTFPEGVYKTDETNINNLWNHIENIIGYPIELVGTEKVDGSSITIGVKNRKGFICSRNLEKPLTVKKHVGRRKKTLLEKILFWTKPNLNIYKEVENDDDFVVHGKPYLEKILSSNEDNTVLRGELNGGSLKGSGNKNNPASKEKANIKFFGIDYIDDLGIAKRVSYVEFKATCTYYELPTCKEVFKQKFYSREEIERVCNEYFKENMIEGIVVRTLDGTFSAKFMNNEYDSKK